MIDATHRPARFVGIARGSRRSSTVVPDWWHRCDSYGASICPDLASSETAFRQWNNPRTGLSNEPGVTVRTAVSPQPVNAA